MFHVKERIQLVFLDTRQTKMFRLMTKSKRNTIPTHLTLKPKQGGFTLIEMIIVIVIGGIVASMTSSILTLPVKAYVDSARRATLTDVAESALRRMQRDIRRALPNSIRITNNGKTLELLHLVDGGRYRARQDASTALPSNILDFTVSDDSAEIIGSLHNFANITTGKDRLVIYPIDASNTYAGENSSLLTGSTTANVLNFNSKQFPFSSPQQRFFIIDSPITYHCDLTATETKDKKLMRYDAYTIQTNQVIPPSSPLDVNGAIQANFVDSCKFTYSSGSSSRAGLVTLEMSFTDDAGESVRLLHQVHVDNQP